MGGETTRWEWPDELDALAAAPEHHRLLLENERVRVLETVVPVAATTPVHTHRWASVEYVLEPSGIVRRDSEGTILLDTRRAPDAALATSEVLWAGPFPPHSVENVGEADLRVIMVELKDQADAGDAPRAATAEIDGLRTLARTALEYVDPYSLEEGDAEEIRRMAKTLLGVDLPLDDQ
ncbi:MAG TPA: hypothetical protein VKD47_09465 [Miltoncostaeaceae bacterium]|nr:hypothetical protein [Miltoncostaeaceae bacterium]